MVVGEVGRDRRSNGVRIQRLIVERRGKGRRKRGGKSGVREGRRGRRRRRRREGEE